MKKIFLYFVIGLMMLVMTMAATFQNFKVPAAYTTLTSRSANISSEFNQTTNSQTTWNMTIYNKSSSSGAYGVLSNVNIIRNATFWNYTATLADKNRHWIYLNITNVTGGPIISSARIIDTDSGYNVLNVGSFGAVNISLDTGDINISGIFRSDSALQLKNGTREVTIGGLPCDSTTTEMHGVIIYNGSLNGGFFGCTNNGWKNLTSQS